MPADFISKEREVRKMPLTERWRKVSGTYEKVRPWHNSYPRDDIEIKMYGSKKYGRYNMKPNISIFSVTDAVRITVPYEEVAKLIREWQNADPAEEYNNDESGDIE